MINPIKTIFQIAIYLVKRALTGSIRFRRETIDFNNEKQSVINALIRQGFTQFSDLIKPPGTGRRLKKKVAKSIFISGLVQNLAYFKTCILHPPNNVFSAKTLQLNYFRIPKVASTSILQVLIAHELSVNTGALSQKQIDVIGELYLERNIDKNALDFQNLAIVRNPLSRLYSVYKNIFQAASQNFIFENYLFGLFNRGMRFSDFIEQLVKIPSIIADPHLKPQYDLIYKHHNAEQMKIFKIEEIETALNPYLQANFGFTLNHLNKSDGKTAAYKDFYTLKTAGKVYKYYQKDFLAFNYTDDFDDLIRRL